MNTQQPYLLYAEENPEDAILVRHIFKSRGQEDRYRVCASFEDIVSTVCKEDRTSGGKATPPPAIVLIGIERYSPKAEALLRRMVTEECFRSVTIRVLASPMLWHRLGGAASAPNEWHIEKPITFSTFSNTLNELIDRYLIQ